MELIGQIYDALDDDELFASLPRLVAEHLGARSCTFQLISPSLTVEGQWTHYFDEAMAQYYIEHDLQRFDEWAVVMRQSGFNRAMRHTDNASIDEFTNSFFYNEFIRRFGDDSAYCLGYGDQRPDGGMVIMGLHKAKRDADFTDEHRSRFEELRPHLTRTAVLRASLRKRESLFESTQAGLDSIEDAFCAIDTTGSLQFANQNAEKLLRDGGLITVKSGSVQFVSPRTQADFIKAIHFAEAHSSEGITAFGALSPDMVRWRVQVLPRRMNGRSLILVWLDKAQISPSAKRFLRQVYDLTEREALVALLVGEGLSAMEIGERISLSVPTVRTHLQHIFEKVGVHKGSQLATLVATLPKIAPEL